MRYFVLFFLLIFSSCSSSSTMQETLHPELAAYVAERQTEFGQIPESRQAELKELTALFDEQLNANSSLSATFICTHNSRRSHMAQLWAQAAAVVYGFADKVKTYSGGTEATAFNPRAVAAMQRAGFAIRAKDAEAKNPNYEVSLGGNIETQTCFSKKFSHTANPQQDFVAVMVCSDADEACPFVPGAAARLALPYVDPKVSDNTPEEAATYDERSAQIAREMLFVFAQLSKK
jgi:protein-tyrosine-phosphatase